MPYLSLRCGSTLHAGLLDLFFGRHLGRSGGLVMQ